MNGGEFEQCWQICLRMEAIVFVNALEYQLIPSVGLVGDDGDDRHD